MTVVGPCVLLIGAAPAVDYGDYVTNILQSPPAPVVISAINRDYSSTPKRGHGITITGVQQDLTEGTLWRYLWENVNEEDVPLVWSPLGDGEVFFQGVIASIPDPAVGGQANQHGTFDIDLALKERPTIVAAPAALRTPAPTEQEEPVPEEPATEEPVTEDAEG